MHGEAIAGAIDETTGNHDVQFYSEPAFLAASVVRFVAPALDGSAAVLLVAPGEELAALGTALAAAGYDLPALQASGRLTLCDAETLLASLLVDGRLDRARFASWIGGMLEGLLDRWGAVQVYGQMVDVLAARGRHQEAIALEELWKGWLPGRAVQLLCGYRTDRFASEQHSEAFRSVCHLHDRVLPGEHDRSSADDDDRQRLVVALEQQTAALRAEVARREEVEACLRQRETALLARSAELSRMNADLERLLEVTAHDLREPLHRIGQYMELLQEPLGSDSDRQVQEFLDRAFANADRMHELLGGLARYSAIREPEDPQPVALSGLVADLRRDFAERLVASQGRLLAGDLPSVPGDAAALRTLLEQLIANALDHAAPGRPPEIRVSVARLSDGWRITVADNGIGIEAAHHERVFEVFRRLPRPEGCPGTGMGLAICRRVVESHGGRIRLDSQPGEGTRVSCFLPEVRP